MRELSLLGDGIETPTSVTLDNFRKREGGSRPNPEGPRVRSACAQYAKRRQVLAGTSPITGLGK